MIRPNAMFWNSSVAVVDVATVVEVERFLHQRRFSPCRHPLSGGEGGVARMVYKLMGKNITGKNRWQE
jgi:hypothetical protein